MLLVNNEGMIESERFEQIITLILDHEGGYVSDPHDSGGETKYGISKLNYPDLDIASLTKEQAKAIYRKDFWEKYKYSRINDINIAGKMFDLSVNIGPYWATCLLQRALKAVGCLNIKEDGIIGPMTIEAVNSSDSKVIIAALRSEAAGYYRSLVISRNDQKKFLTGWLNRAYA